MWFRQTTRRRSQKPGKDRGWELGQSQPDPVPLKAGTHVLVGQADPEGEAVRLHNLIQVLILLDVVDAGQVSSTHAALLQSLVPRQLLVQHFVG